MDRYQLVAATLAAAITLYCAFMRLPLPTRWATGITTASGLVASVTSALGFVLYPTPAYAKAVGIAVVILAVLPPLLGLAFALPPRKRDIYDYLSARARPTRRFWMHLATNLVGALTAYWALLYAASRTMTASPDETNAAVLANVIVPLAVLIIMSFVRGQQRERVAPTGEALTDEGPVPRHVRSYLLSAPPELVNTLYLIVATFLTFASILLQLTSLIESAKAGEPQPLTLDLMLLFIIGTCFLVVCGTPWATKSRYVYLTFLTGMPIAMGTVLFFLALLESSTLRNAFALVYLAVSGATYGALVVVREGRIGEGALRDRLHHFTGAIVATVIGVLLLVVLLS